ncbi:MAG: SUMF1/EgtB/PvdO family nonheme iron enzyme [Colwellia sp.]|nr:SUMF1/EgtB/PvdO family nonheme iron enzyme [Colwellia sp.]
MIVFLFITSCAQTNNNNNDNKLNHISNKTINKQKQGDVSTSQQDKYVLSEALLTKLNNAMVWVEGGSFDMGSNAPKARKRERPAHQVSLDGFYISKFELTQDLFSAIMGWNNSYYQCANCPMNNVSWFNMLLFIERLNIATGHKYRLPTEAEWAYAAKGGQKTKNLLFSGSNNIDTVAWYSKNSNRQSHPVGQKQPNELGLYDMTGNLWEFCQDNLNPSIYRQPRQHNPFYGDLNNSHKKAMKVLRGGGYEFSADESLVFIRDGATNNVRMADIGFRLAMSLQ